ncbi:MAG: Ig-like domain-containing protein [Fidelibacterota bacterium]
MKPIKYIFLLLIFSSMIFAQDMSGIKICIDPGHGGHESDDRYIPETGFWESEGNLTKARAVKKYLEALGAEIVLTRTGNGNHYPDDPSLSQRVEIANSNNADIFHSIHSNGYNGSMNYTLMLFQGWDTDPTWDAALEISNIMGKLLKTANRTTSLHIRGDFDFYGTGRPYLGVLKNLQMPGQLSEGSFHDYIPESWRLQNLDYRKKEAWAIANSFVKYFLDENIDQRLLAGLVRSKYEYVSYNYIGSLGDQYLPINNAKVKMVPTASPADSAVYITDEMNNGFFMFDTLDAGEYSLIVTADNYYPDTSVVEIDDKLFNFNDFSLVSKVPPVVKETTPANNDPAFPAWDPINIKFSRSLDTTGFSSHLTITPATTYRMVWRESNTLLWIIPDSLQFETEYTITLSGDISDTFGHPLDGNADGTGGDGYSFSFVTTPADIEAPEILSSYPEVGSADIETNPIINITFNELINDSTLTGNYVKLENFATKEYVPITLEVNHAGEKTGITIIPENTLEPGILYITRILPGITDMYGNATTTKKSYSFKTTDMDIDISEIDDFESGVDYWWEPGQSGSTVGTDPNITGMKVNSDTTNPLTTSTQAMHINYGWDENSDNDWLLREYLNGGPARNTTFNKENIMQAYVFGDGSMNEFRFAVDDDINGSGGHEVSPWYVIDWIGWKLVSWDMSTNETGEWIGDGSLDGTLRVDSFQLRYNPDSDAALAGSIVIDDFRLVDYVPVAIDNEIAAQPDQFHLEQNYPNPFNPTTRIDFSIPQAGKVKIAIYNIKGELVKSYDLGNRAIGRHNITWNARDNSDRPVAAGTYIYQVHYRGKIYSNKMLFLK